MNNRNLSRFSVIGDVRFEKANGILDLLRLVKAQSYSTDLPGLLLIKCNSLPGYNGQFYFDNDLNDFIYSE